MPLLSDPDSGSGIGPHRHEPSWLRRVSMECSRLGKGPDSSSALILPLGIAFAAIMPSNKLKNKLRYELQFEMGYSFGHVGECN